MHNFLTLSADSSYLDVKNAYDVAHNVALLSLEMAANNDSRMHWAEVVRLVESRFFKYHSSREVVQKHTYKTTISRAPELERIERQLNEVAVLSEIVREQVLQQMPLVNSLERNVETLTTRLDASSRELEDAAPRIYHSARRNYDCWPRSMIARLRCCIAALVVLHFFFITSGII